MSASDKKIRLCIVLRAHHAAFMGGAQYQAKLITEELLKTGRYEIFYLACMIDSSFDALEHGYHVLQITDVSRGVSKRTSLFDRSALQQLLCEIKPDAIYQQALTPYTAFCAEYASKNDVPFLYHIASDFDVIPGKVFSQRLFRKVIERAEKALAERVLTTDCAIIAQTQRQSSLLQKHYGREADIIFPNLLPLPEHLPEKSVEPLNVLWVANIKPVKQPALFVELAKRLEYMSNVRFVMVGSKSSDPAFDSLYADIETQDNLDYLGGCSQEQVNELLTTSHLLVNTSITEGYSNTFVQAWASLVPVVSINADVDGVLKRGELGLCAGDFDGFVSDVECLLTDASRRELMAQNARKYAQTHNALKNIDKLDDLIQSKIHSRLR